MFLLLHLPVLARTLLISGIAVLTLVGIMLRPFQWNEALTALAGAALRELRKHISWSIFGFIAGMFIIVRAVETTGLRLVQNRSNTSRALCWITRPVPSFWLAR